MSGYHLQCRVCEEIADGDPVDACRRCDGPTDVVYDWAHVEHHLSRTLIGERPQSLWRYRELLPTEATVDVGAGWTRLVPCEPLSDLLELDLWLKLESENPTRSYKDRVGTLAVSAALDLGRDARSAARRPATSATPSPLRHPRPGSRR